MNEQMQIVNFNSWQEVALFTLILFAVVFMRYVAVSAVFFGVFYRVASQKYASRKVTKGQWRRGQLTREVAYSAITSLIFAGSGVVMVWAWQQGLTKVYLDAAEYGHWYLPVSLLVALLVHETYYYWAHRLMHHPSLFRHVHRVHHESLISSPWTSFSFHPWESVLQALVVPVLVLVLPMHVGVLLTMLTIMTVSAVINHLDIEIFPARFEKHWLGRWLIGATHHSLHHAEFTSNYGLYFTFWDKWMRTESGRFEKLFREKASGGARR